MSLRYLSLNEIREDFTTFVNAYDSSLEDVGSEGERRLTGVALGHIVEDSVKNFNLYLNFCIGFGVKKTAERAMRCPCSNPILNNSLSPKLDLKKATEAIEDTKCILQNKRSNSESVFRKLYYEVKEIAEQLDIKLRMPRIVYRQNQPANSREEYFRRSMYLPVLDNILTDLEERLSPEVMDLFNLRVVLSKRVVQNNGKLSDSILKVLENCDIYNP
ncbi:unnamed protein product [Diabrotica balteata]|uniref:Uncharacterized protein n=1 Tax=Diabrotica balteata TaxID=107213 RepID=A0A9N9SM43_DIABA|nr:unnamed protein product [Diabrotica balteata]